MQDGTNKVALKKFGLMMGLIIACLFGLILPWLKKYHSPYWPWLVAAVFILMAMGAPRLLQPVYRLWMRFGEMMSRLMTPLIMGSVYFLILTPLALCMRAARRDILGIHNDKTSNSYRVQSRSRPKESMKRPF